MPNRGGRATRRVAIGVKTDLKEKKRVPNDHRASARGVRVLDGAPNEMGRGNPGRAPVEPGTRLQHRSSHERAEEALLRGPTSGRGGCGSFPWVAPAKSARA
jgi:hypothetical protein